MKICLIFCIPWPWTGPKDNTSWYSDQWWTRYSRDLWLNYTQRSWDDDTIKVPIFNLSDSAFEAISKGLHCSKTGNRAVRRVERQVMELHPVFQQLCIFPAPPLCQKGIWSFDRSGKSPESWYRSHMSGWIGGKFREVTGKALSKCYKILSKCYNLSLPSWRIGLMGGKSKWYLSPSLRVLHFAVVCQN